MSSQFSNAADGAPDAAEAYIKGILQLLGDADPMRVLSDTFGQLNAVCEAVPRKCHDVQEGPDKWSLNELMAHLADSDLVWSYRMKKILSEEAPAIEGYDQDAWARNLSYRARPTAESLRLFSTIRTDNLRLIGSVSESELDRYGTHLERGEETLRHMIRLYAGHDLVHIRQAERIRKAVQDCNQ